MLCFARARLVFNIPEVTVSSRPFFSSFLSTLPTTLRSQRRALFTKGEPRFGPFDVTGIWRYDETLDVDGLRRLAADSVHQKVNDIVSFSKLNEGDFNCTFVITLRGDRQVIARVPFPGTAAKHYAVASEVATLEYLRSHGIPAPEVYSYSINSDNAAGTPYILMDFVEGPRLSDVWPSLRDEEVVSVVRQLTQLESQMTSLSFPAGGSLYYTDDLERIALGLGVPLDDKRFCVGPDTRVAFWYGGRRELHVNRGPYQSAEEALAAAAHKEIAHVKRLPTLPLLWGRQERPAHKRREQSPSLLHIECLELYLGITSSLLPSDPALRRFCIRHPDLQPSNIVVSRSAESGCKIVSLLDWQHASILPMFLHAGVPQRLHNHRGFPQRLQNDGDLVSQAMMVPSLPENFNEMSEAEQAKEQDLYRRRLVHHHYVISTKECNQLHHTAFTDHLYALRRRLFLHSSAPWEYESSDLKAALIQARENWEKLTGGGVPCPIKFSQKDSASTKAILTKIMKANPV